MNNNNKLGSALFMRTKREIKWYKKLWNIITFRKEQNYKWVEIGTIKSE